MHMTTPTHNVTSGYELRDLLDEAGHLHLFLDSGAEAKVSKHDTSIEKGIVTIDSDTGTWTFPASKIEFADVEPSELVPA